MNVLHITFVHNTNLTCLSFTSYVFCLLVCLSLCLSSVLCRWLYVLMYFEHVFYLFIY